MPGSEKAAENRGYISKIVTESLEGEARLTGAAVAEHAKGEMNRPGSGKIKDASSGEERRP